MEEETTYNLTFTAGALLMNETCAVAEVYLETGRNWEITKDAAICLYTAIMTDTGNFRFENTNPNAFRAVAELELKETYLRSHWALVVRRYESYGLTLMKRGRGRTADFGVKGYNDKEVRWEHKEGSIF